MGSGSTNGSQKHQMLTEAQPTTQQPTKSKRNAFTPETSQKAVQAKLKRSKATAEFVESLKHEPLELSSLKLRDFINNNPTQRKEVIKELIEQNLFVRLKHQQSLIFSGDPLKKAEARKEDLGIGLEYDKLYKEQDSEALTIRIPSALVGRLSDVLALKIAPVDTSSTPARLENQIQDASNTAVINVNPDSESVHSGTSDNVYSVYSV